MNNKFLTSRYYQIMVLVIILTGILAVRLFVLTVIQNDKWSKEAINQSIETIYTSATRGDILDRNGTVIATSKQIFSITFNASSLETKEINDSAYALMNILDKNNEKYDDDFPIKISSSGNLYYTYKSKIRNWLKKHNFDTGLTAEEVFNKLRAKYNIDPTLDRYEAMDVLQEKHGVDAPITVKTMKYTYDEDLDEFLEIFGFTDEQIKSGISATECFKQLRKDYSINKSLSNKQARKIFVIRYKVKVQGFMKYIPIVVSKNVSKKTITYVEEYGDSIKGVNTISETERYYPKKNLASHIIGYMGSISDAETKEYVEEKGYKITDLIGKAGIEANYEDQLHGEDGIKQILVNSAGEYIETINETEAAKGKDIYLTIDAKLQTKVEDILERIVKCTQTGSVFSSKYGSNLAPTQASKCQSGAIVALDVDTGEVLAMASYPDYNPNIFAEGISTKAWASVQSKNERDSLSPTPLYSLATSSSIQPGSTFKPITSMAALDAGLNPNREIYDGRYIEFGDRKYGCDLYNSGGGSHGYENLAAGIGNSCNYYFYCVGTGVDYNTHSSLGYKITTQDIMDEAAKFGLDEKTGIEISENIAPIASEDAKTYNMKVSLWNYLYNHANSYWKESVTDDYDTLKAEVDTICNWIEEDPSRDKIVSLLKEKTKVKSSQVETLADTIKYSYFNFSKWTLGDTFNLCIGQGDNAYTPLQMARYVATIGNGGTLNKVNVVKGVEGEGITQKDKGEDIGLDSSKLGEVLKGMHRVTTNGTLAGVFGSFPIEVCGKTGTAEKAGYIQPKNEVAYVKSHLGQLTSSVSWSQVKKWMTKLMKADKETYPTKNDAVDDALIKASKGKVTQEAIDANKGTYDPFAWTIALAPADNPQIAVVVMLVQGKISYNAGIAAREVLGSYLLDKDSSYNTITNETKIN